MILLQLFHVRLVAEVRLFVKKLEALFGGRFLVHQALLDLGRNELRPYER